MSSYGNEMEREYSTQSLPTRGGSEMGSRYMTETGLYMSPFAATIFISGLVTFGISLMSVLIGLAVMLRSCQSRNSGVVELYRSTQGYDYCWNIALHAELNSLGADVFPEICNDINKRYVKEGQYRRDLNITVSIAEDFFSSIKPRNDGRDVVLMDADDFLYSNQLIYRANEDALNDSNRYADYLKQIFVMKLYVKLNSRGWPLILLSRKPEKLRNRTAGNLMSMGCRGWSLLIMRRENEMQMDNVEFVSRQRNILQREGYTVAAVISSQMDVIRGRFLGDRIFKLPNPIFHVQAQY